MHPWRKKSNVICIGDIQSQVAKMGGKLAIKINVEIPDCPERQNPHSDEPHVQTEMFWPCTVDETAT
jgi:hypothetical protein